MKSSNNKFKSALKVDTNTTETGTLNKEIDTNLLLHELGLFPLPSNVQASISDDRKYLNMQLKNSDTKKHILFQFPLKKQDLSALENRDDYQDLIDRYNLYTNDYIDEIKKYATMERAYLQKKFPGLVFSIKIRIKSRESYIKKLNENILKGKDPYINDIMAERIVISKYNECEKESVLIEMCDTVAKALYDFRINTNFRMKKDISPNETNSEKEYITKDYIQHPKKNGYKSIHILIEHINNADFAYETQIRTFNMENLSKTSGEIAHSKYKPRILNDLSANRVPLYAEISSFTDEFGNPIIIDLPFENRFYHFYNSNKNDHSDKNNLKTSPITYKKFRSEQYELENLLGIKFKDIRKKLRDIDEQSKKQISNEKVR